VLGFNSSFSVDRVGRSGGLTMFWQSSLNFQVFDYSQNHISLEIMDTDRGDWRLTGYYGYPNGGRRHASWDLLRTLSHQSSLLWCIFGNNGWFSLFPNAKLENLVAPASDHYPIFLEYSPVARPHPNRRKF
jgi:hypothetical protein